MGDLIMNIATALNRKYLEYTVVMLCSLCENNNEHIDAYLLHSELFKGGFMYTTSTFTRHFMSSRV